MNQLPKSMRLGTTSDEVFACKVWAEVGIEILSDFGEPDMPKSIMSYIAWYKAVQRSEWCPTNW